jgi:hypothetical protein
MQVLESWLAQQEMRDGDVLVHFITELRPCIIPLWRHEQMSSIAMTLSKYLLQSSNSDETSRFVTELLDMLCKHGTQHSKIAALQLVFAQQSISDKMNTDALQSAITLLAHLLTETLTIAIEQTKQLIADLARTSMSVASHVE